MPRRSISLCDDQADLNQCDFNQLQKVNKKDEVGKPCFIRHLSFQVLRSSAIRTPQGKENSDLSCGWSHSSAASTHPPYGFPNEEDVSHMLRSAVGFSMTRYLQIVALPIIFILTFAYLFTYVPALPETEAYRRVSSTFAVLMGITLQCCFVTAWAARKLGFGDFLQLLRYAISGYL